MLARAPGRGPDRARQPPQRIHACTASARQLEEDVSQRLDAVLVGRGTVHEH